MFNWDLSQDILYLSGLFRSFFIVGLSDFRKLMPDGGWAQSWEMWGGGVAVSRGLAIGRQREWSINRQSFVPEGPSWYETCHESWCTSLPLPLPFPLLGHRLECREAYNLNFFLCSLYFYDYNTRLWKLIYYIWNESIYLFQWKIELFRWS